MGVLHKVLYFENVIELQTEIALSVIFVAMQIDRIVCPEDIADKLESKHNVTCAEAEEVLLNRPRIRFVEKGYTEGDDVYAAFGQTFAGRFLVVFFIYKLIQKLAIIISTRDMSKKQRKAYGRK